MFVLQLIYIFIVYVLAAVLYIVLHCCTYYHCFTYTLTSTSYYFQSYFSAVPHVGYSYHLRPYSSTLRCLALLLYLVRIYLLSVVLYRYLLYVLNLLFALFIVYVLAAVPYVVLHCCTCYHCFTCILTSTLINLILLYAIYLFFCPLYCLRPCSDVLHCLTLLYVYHCFMYVVHTSVLYCLSST